METLDWRFKIDHEGTTPFYGLGNLTLKKNILLKQFDYVMFWNAIISLQY